jgi:two-component system sensor histidine kinase KdpD
VVPLTGNNTAQVTAAFIRDNRITQAIVGRSAVHGIRSYLYYLAIQKFMSEAPHVDLHIVTREKR